MKRTRKLSRNMNINVYYSFIFLLSFMAMILVYTSYLITSKFQVVNNFEYVKSSMDFNSPYEYALDEKTITNVARSFYPWRGHRENGDSPRPNFPCFSGEDNQHKEGTDLKGLIYVKIHKSSSSTLAGINLRIAHRHGSSESNICAVHYEHKTAKQLKLSDRDPSKTFLWTFVRHPTSLSTSRLFFFDVTRGDIILNNTTESNDHLIQHLKRKKDDNVSFQYLNPFSSKFNSLKKLPKIIKRVIDEYDFIGMVERFDESLVVLRLLLGLNAGDIIYVRSKVGGSYDNAFDRHKCIKTAPSFITESMKKYYSSKEFHKKHSTDFLLYDIVSKSLDLTIQRIGISKFQTALKEHKYLMSLVDKICAPVAKFPCSIEGKHQGKLAKKNCYKYDYGCGYPCLDSISQENIATNML